MKKNKFNKKEIGKDDFLRNILKHNDIVICVSIFNYAGCFSVLFSICKRYGLSQGWATLLASRATLETN